jgi:hypothetical protein
MRKKMKKYLLAASIFAIPGLPVWSAQATPVETFGKAPLVTEYADFARKDGDRERANHAARENQARGRQDHAAREAQPGDDRGNHGGRHANAATWAPRA